MACGENMLMFSGPCCARTLNAQVCQSLMATLVAMAGRAFAEALLILARAYELLKRPCTERSCRRDAVEETLPKRPCRRNPADWPLPAACHHDAWRLIGTDTSQQTAKHCKQVRRNYKKLKHAEKGQRKYSCQVGFHWPGNSGW